MVNFNVIKHDVFFNKKKVRGGWIVAKGKGMNLIYINRTLHVQDYVYVFRTRSEAREALRRYKFYWRDYEQHVGRGH